MCEVISCRDAHPGVSGGWLLLTGLAVLTAGETEGAVDGSVVELREARQAAGEVVGGAGVRVERGQAGSVVSPSVGEEPRGQGALILHRQLLLYQVGQRLTGDVEGIEAEVVVLLFAGRAEAKGRLPVCGRRHWYCVCEEKRDTLQELKILVNEPQDVFD